MSTAGQFLTDLCSYSDATFSPCGRYRYRLWREWNVRLPRMLCVMLNPSTADEKANDPTVERCQRRAIALGFGALEVVNLFALRSTDPAALYAQADPIGPDNDQHIMESAALAGMVLCGWGTHGAHLGRGNQVEAMLRSWPGIARKLHVLKVNADGSPKHPLYVAYAHRPVPWAA